MATKKSVPIVKVVQSSREAMAVTGYMTRVSLQASDGDFFVVLPDVDVPQIRMRVRKADVAEIRKGHAKGDMILAQLILVDGAKVESVTETLATDDGMKAFHDPVLNRVRQEAVAKKIMM